MSARAVGILLGKCMPSVKTNASRICVTKLELDEYLHAYFKKIHYVYAHDPEKLCKTGDIVLVEELPEKMSKLITHKVRKVVFPCGDVVDPLTGKRVVAKKYRDDIIETKKAYGENEESFDYDKAPPRGWLEGKKDFTDKKTYIKYHDDPNKDDPYAL